MSDVNVIIKSTGVGGVVADINRVHDAGEKAAGGVGKVGIQLKDLARQIAGPAIAAASVAGLYEGAKKAVGAATELGATVFKLRGQLGGTAEDASHLHHALDETTSNAAASETAILRFAKGLAGLADSEDLSFKSGKPLIDNLKSMGIEANDATGHIRPMAEILPQVADAFKGMPDGVEKTALAIQLFGKSGAVLLPFLNQGSKGIAEFSAEADRLGLTLSDAQTDKLRKFHMEVKNLGDQFEGAQVQLGLLLIPSLMKAITLFNQGQVSLKDLAKSNSGLVGSLKELVHELSPLAPIVKAVFVEAIEVAKTKLASFGGEIKSWVDLIKDGVKLVKAVFTGDWKQAWQSAKDIALDILKGLAYDVQFWIGASLESALNLMIAFVNKAIDVANKATGAFNKVNPLGDVGKIGHIGDVSLDLMDATDISFGKLNGTMKDTKDGADGLTTSFGGVDDGTAKLRKGVDYLGDGILTLAEATALGLDALKAGAVEAVNEIATEQDRANESAFTFSKTLAKVAVAFKTSEDAAVKMVKSLASAALTAAKAAGGALFGRPTQESAQLELDLANFGIGKLDLESRINPQIDALREQLAGLDRSTGDATTAINAQKAALARQLAQIQSQYVSTGLLTAAQEAERDAAVAGVKGQMDALDALSGATNATKDAQKDAIQRQIDALQAQLDAYDKQGAAIQLNIDRYNAQAKVMEASLTLADKTLLTQDEQVLKFAELRDMVSESSGKVRELSTKLGEDLLPEMDTAREAYRLSSDAAKVLANEAFRDSLIPTVMGPDGVVTAFDAVASRAWILALAKDEEKAATDRVTAAMNAAADKAGEGAVSLDPWIQNWKTANGFATGIGNVPGSRGAGDNFPALLSPGEAVLTPGQADRWRAGGGGGGGPVVNLVVHGSILSERNLLRIIRDAIRGGGLEGLTA